MKRDRSQYYFFPLEIQVDTREFVLFLIQGAPEFNFRLFNFFEAEHQGSTNCSILPSCMGELGVSWENMENRENMEDMENINQVT